MTFEMAALVLSAFVAVGILAVIGFTVADFLLGHKHGGNE